MSTDYSLIDATLEILLMLLAAFLLGWLFCWLMKKLFGRKPKAINPSRNVDMDAPSLKGASSGLAGSNRERLYNSDANLDLDVDTPDLNRPGVNLNDVDLPNKPGIKRPTVDIAKPEIDVNQSRPRIDLPDLNTPDLDLKNKLDTGFGSGKAALGKGLGAAAAGIGAAAVGASAFKDKAVDKVSNLDLNVNTPDLDMPDVAIDSPDVSMPDVDVNLPEVDTPNFEAEIDLPEIAQPSLNTEIDLPDVPDISVPEAGKNTVSAGMGAAAVSAGAIAAGAASFKDTTLNKANEIDDRLTRPDLPTSTQTVGASDGRVEYAQSGTDDLTRISGIDNQVVSVLNAKGINTYQDLQATNRSQLKGYLDATSDAKLREIEPASWPHQATLCANRNWTKLSEYQSFLTGSNLDTRQATAAYSVGEGDDLKKVEGIGPFFESLLNDAGITTYEHLKNSDRDTLKEIIDAAGPDYRMHEPETWPYQAGLAHRGEWKKLQDYIQFMTGRG